MVCNAGIALRAEGADVTEDDFRRLMSVNLDGVLFGAQATARQMKAQGKPGSILLMGSMGGIAGAGVTVAYSTSRGGIVLMASPNAPVNGSQRAFCLADGAALSRRGPVLGSNAFFISGAPKPWW
jgi:NAD(P)-dependent dehydrogenase (short-subunit alcohol dehydrogenase family)